MTIKPAKEQSIIKDILIEAGQYLQSYQKKEIKVRNKLDNSPVTEADIEANRIICQQLQTKTETKNILSEENTKEENQKARKNTDFWLLDPLDGTKGYIGGNKNFAICLAKIKNNKPVEGYIYMPIHKQLYFTQEQESFLWDIEKDKIKKIKVSSGKDRVVISSRMKNNQLFTKFLELNPYPDVKVTSSAYKYCLLAEGKADIFPHFAETSIWDSAPGDLLIRNAGGEFLNLAGEEFTYGKDDNYKNKYFIASNKCQNIKLP
jgi:3'(2'), 5'-bisphosphate nucleotidase